jgi:hypothetical protein
MMSITDSTVSRDRAELTAHVNAKVNALPNLTDGVGGQREKVRGIATAWALSHGTLLQKSVVDGKTVVTAVGEPNYEGLANHVRNNPNA